MVYFSMAGETPNRTLSLFYSDASNATVPEDHPKFDQLLDAVISGADETKVRYLADLFSAVGQQLQQISERVTYFGRRIYFDGDPLAGELSDVIRDLAESGDPEELRPLVNFLEKTKTNPSQQSVDSLYRWITNGDLVIHEDGDFLAYKGVGYGDAAYEDREQLKADGIYYSVHQGEAFVDGQHIEGHIPNKVGSIVTMPRSTVNSDTGVGCSTGLHAGTHGYATSYANAAMLLVKINPRDVVSVPDDSSFQKLRVCRYEVLDVTEKRLEEHVYFQPSFDDWDEDDDDDDDEDEDLEWDDELDGEEFDDEEDDFEEPMDDEDNESYEEEFDSLSDEVKDQITSELRSADGPTEAFEAWVAGDLTESDEDVESPKLEALAAKESPFEEPEEEPKAVRNSKGQFTKESVKNAFRDPLGRFRGLKG